MLNFKKLKKGDVLSEFSTFTVEEVLANGITVKDKFGNSVEIGTSYVERVLCSDSQFTEQQAVTRTELSEIVASNKNVAMQVYFKKADTKKTKKAYNQELDDRASLLESEFMNKGRSVLKDALINPVLPYIEGEMRIMRGYSLGTKNAQGLLEFIDVEDDSKVKQVNPRTLEYVVVNNIKYSRK